MSVTRDVLVVEAAAADYDAFFRAEYAGVLRVVQGVLGDRARAEEVAQEAFVRLYVRWDRISQYDRPDAWIRRVAIRLAVKVARRDGLRGLVERRVAPMPEAPQQTDLTAVLAQLPRAQRIAVALHYLEDRPVADVAVVLGCKEATARVHLHRARKRLTELISWQVDDE